MTAPVPAPSRLRRSLQRPTTWLSAVLLLAAGAFVALSNATDVAADWWPNLATLAVEIAATITVVEWLIGRERRQRLQPRTERTYYWLGVGIRTFASTVMHDYTVTHRASYRGMDLPEFG